jgi:hypothetical protein
VGKKVRMLRCPYHGCGGSHREISSSSISARSQYPGGRTITLNSCRVTSCVELNSFRDLMRAAFLLRNSKLQSRCSIFHFYRAVRLRIRRAAVYGSIFRFSTCEASLANCCVETSCSSVMLSKYLLTALVISCRALRPSLL